MFWYYYANLLTLLMIEAMHSGEMFQVNRARYLDADLWPNGVVPYETAKGWGKISCYDYRVYSGEVRRFLE